MIRTQRRPKSVPPEVWHVLAITSTLQIADVVADRMSSIVNETASWFPMELLLGFAKALEASYNCSGVFVVC